MYLSVEVVTKSGRVYNSDWEDAGDVSRDTVLDDKFDDFKNFKFDGGLLKVLTTDNEAVYILTEALESISPSLYRTPPRSHDIGRMGYGDVLG